MTTSSVAICTITTASHQRQAACLLESYLQHHPGGRCYVLHVDGVQPEPMLDRPEIVRLELAALRVPGVASMRARYNMFEFCNALKPFLLKHLFETTAHDRLCYYDGDIFFFGSSQAAVWDELRSCAILLTPHLVHVPGGVPDLIWRDLAVLQHGVFNAGFIGLRRGVDAGHFLDWWGDRTRRLGQKKLEEGLNCDQRWLDLLPGFDLALRVSRHPGLNAAYWNLHERQFKLVDGGFQVNDQPLVFYHFSGYAPDRPDAITRNWTKFTFDNRPDLLPLFARYRQALQEAQQPFALPQPVAGSQHPSRPAAASQAVALPTGRSPDQDGPSPQVSVIIPAYNAGPYLRTAIDSVLAQTLADVEIIVVDDGSNDDTANIAASFGERVRLLRQDNAGVSAARNRGIEAARADFVAFLDADDWYLLPTKLASQAALLAARPEVGIVHSGWRLVNEQGDVKAERRPWQRVPVLDLQGWLLWQPALPSAMMVRRQALAQVGGFDPRLAHAEDIDLALRLTLAGYATAWLEEVTVAYRQHGSSATRRVAETEIDVHIVMDRFFARSDLPAQAHAIAPRVRFGVLMWLALQYYRAQAFADMARVLRATLPYASGASPAAMLLTWLDNLEFTLREDYGERLNAYALCQRPEWQAMVQSHVIGPAPEQASVRQGPVRLAALTRPPALTWRPSSLAVSPEPGPQSPAEPKLDLSGALGRDYGRHRSGWAFALQSLMPLHCDDGIWVDAFPEHTFGDSPPTAQSPHRRPWIGFMHNPPRMPEWFVYNQSPQSLLSNKAFQASLPDCLGLFCLSDYHAGWLRERLDVPIAVVRHPTVEPTVSFSLDRFFANPTKRIVQIGAWLRKLNAIYFLPVRRLKRTIMHQHRPYIDELIAQERSIFHLQPDETGVETLPFVDDAQYDELLAGNIVFMELYDSSANNVIVECIVRATPVLVNPLPAVVEYLGREYPFYSHNRMQAARKAEDMALIAETHGYLLQHPLRLLLSGDAFLRAVAGSEVYRRLPAHGVTVPAGSSAGGK